MTDAFEDHFSSASDAYRAYRPTYPDALFNWLASRAPATGYAVDIGCGNGQASLALAQRFERVLATDPSTQQLAHAPTATNLIYRCEAAEALEIPSASADLITVAQAIHWFDHPRFFERVSESLKPGGLLACWGYQLVHCAPRIDAVVSRLHGEIIGPYWPPKRALLEDGYVNIPFPYPRLETPTFTMHAEWTLETLMSYLQTWSAVKAFYTANGHDPVERLRPELEAAWVAEWGQLREPRPVSWPLILYVGANN